MIAGVSTPHVSTTVRRIFSAVVDLSTPIRGFFYAIFHTPVDTKNRLFSTTRPCLSTVYTLIPYFIIVVVWGSYRAVSTGVDTVQTGWAK